MDILDIISRAFFSAVVLFIFTKLMGKKQISQLNFFDYVLGITIGSIAAEMSFDRDIPFHYPIIAMGIYTLCEILISFLSAKSIKLRRLFIGSPLIVINEGKFIEKNLKKSRLDINEFLTELRKQGYFNISDVHFAVMETNGSISIIPKSSAKPATVEDLKLVIQQEGLCANVIIDGKIMFENLEMAGLSEDWLKAKLREQERGDVSSILLAIVDNNGVLTVFDKNNSGPKTGIIG